MKVEGPFCKKCGGDLEHSRADDLWICQKCGCGHIYVKNKMSEVEIQWKQLSDRVSYCADQVTHGLQELMDTMIQLGQTIQEKNYGSQGLYEQVGEVMLGYQHSYELFCNTVRIAKDMIEGSGMTCDDGHFELLSDVIV